jgi:hypothetical protein
MSYQLFTKLCVCVCVFVCVCVCVCLCVCVLCKSARGVWGEGGSGSEREWE